MNLALGGLHLSSCLIYLNNIIIVGKYFDNYLNYINLVLTKIRRAGLKVGAISSNYYSLFTLTWTLISISVTCMVCKPLHCEYRGVDY